jgi:colanic acid biosynthesis glycosyl transferase WcaI
VNILVFSQWFPPEPGGGPARFLEMARVWVEEGHRVTVIAGLPNWPTGEIHPDYRRRFRVLEEIDGIEVIRTWVYATRNEGVLKRVLNHTSFMASSPLEALFSRSHPDVVVATSPPIFAALAGLGVAKALRVPFVFDVRDLWPDAIFALGQMQQPVVRKLLLGAERLLYQQADVVVPVSAGFTEHIRGRGARAVEIIPNGADTERFSPGIPDELLREEWGWKGRFVVLYAGTLGMAHGLGAVLDAAAELRDEPVLFALVGDGAERGELEDRRAAEGLQNVQILPLQPRERMTALYRSADACLVSLKPLELFDSFIPSKVFEIMATARPIIAAVKGTALDIIEEAGAGFAVEPGSALALAAVVRKISSDRDLLHDMGFAGRLFMERHFDRHVLALRYLDMLGDIVDRKKRR